jgi:hypothetical protein
MVRRAYHQKAMKPRHALLAAVLGAASLAWGETPEFPERIAQLSYVEGQVAFQGAQEFDASGLPDRPLAAGDRLVTHPGARAEIAFGNATVRLDERTELAIDRLDGSTVRIGLDAGVASVILRDLREGEAFEVATANATMMLAEPGEYRVEARADDLSVLTVRGGAVNVETAGGPVRIAGGQRARLTGRDVLASLETPRPADAFDDWVLEREVRLADSEPPREGLDYEELERYGEWYDEPNYGHVWMPSYAYGGWDPFGYGSWQHVGYGYAWVDPMPWSYYTNYGGHWAYLHHLDRWCWVPARRDLDNKFGSDTKPFGGLARNSQTLDERRPAVKKFNGTNDRLRIGTVASSAGRATDSPRKAAPAPKLQSRSSKTDRSDSSSERRAAAPSTMTSKSTRESGVRPLP